MFYFDIDLLIERADEGEATFTRNYPQFTWSSIVDEISSKKILNIAFCKAFKQYVNVRLMWNHFMKLYWCIFRQRKICIKHDDEIWLAA